MDMRKVDDFDVSFRAAIKSLVVGNLCRKCCSDMALNLCGFGCAGSELFSVESIFLDTQRTDNDKVSHSCEFECAAPSDFVVETFCLKYQKNFEPQNTFRAIFVLTTFQEQTRIWTRLYVNATVL